MAATLWLLALPPLVLGADSPGLKIGLGVREVTPKLPLRLAGYASRDHAFEKADTALLVQAMAWEDGAGERLALVALDNCEVDHHFTETVRAQINAQNQTKPGSVIIVSSHTHSGPILDGALDTMYELSAEELQRTRDYTKELQAQIVNAVGEAFKNLQPARIEYGIGRATFAMNRRIFKNGKIGFGDNPDGPVDWEVPVLRVLGTNDAVRAILFGYACHGTSVRKGDDFYTLSGEYMAYARQHLEAVYPGAVAMYMTGMGADADPAPRGPLLAAKRHGLELAGAVAAVLDKPMRPVSGNIKLAYQEVALPLVEPPGREQLQKDTQSKNAHERKRAENFLKLLDEHKPLPASISLPMAAVRLGDELTFLVMGGEVVVDYAIRFKRIFAAEHPWTIGYAYEVPCYIPSSRLIKEGGYEVESSLIFYGLYGPFQGLIEDKIIENMTALVAKTKAK